VTNRNLNQGEKTMKAVDLMTSNLDSIRTDDSIKKAASEMEKYNIGALPVQRDGKTVGIITDRDIVVRSTAKGFDPETTKVEKAFSSDIIACDAEDDVETVMDLMEKNQIRRVLVRNQEGRVAGIISLGDIAVSMRKEAAGEVIQKVSEPSETRK
jgi:CBS domain-containing protein